MSRPASLAQAHALFATAGSACEHESSAAPTSMCGPPACAAGASAQQRQEPIEEAPSSRPRLSSSRWLRWNPMVAALRAAAEGACPPKPGVYLFRGADGSVLYVGKAKSLRPRVRSYFQAGLERHAARDPAARRARRRRSR